MSANDRIATVVGQAYTLPSRFPLPRKTLATAKVQQMFEFAILLNREHQW